MTEETKIKGEALRSFRDAGAETAFQEGKVYDFGEGAFGNYKHAGLVKAADANSDVAEPIPAPTPPRADD